jgi:predicted TIM-barrel fold metal-dependent hydrolase
VTIDSLLLRLIRPLAGANPHLPQDFWTNASSEAQQLAREALVPFEKSLAPLDYHAHLLGNDIGLQPPAVHSNMLSWRYPFSHLRYLFYFSALKVSPHYKNFDYRIRDHLLQLVKHARDPFLSSQRSYRMQLLAIDRYFTPSGSFVPKQTHFYVSNDYLMKTVQENPLSFSPVFSIHPYRKDALSELARCHAFFEEWRERLVTTGLIKQEEAIQIPKMLKWLPNSMGIDPSHPQCTPFYEGLKEFKFTLLSHAGDEPALPIDRAHQKLGNPLLLRHALRAGVNTIIAHCAALGKNSDFDNGNRSEANFALCMRMIKQSIGNPQKGEGKLFGDLSALSTNLCYKQLMTLLDTPEIHGRLINGSDYPIPAINALIWLGQTCRRGLITKQETTLLREIYQYNPLLMDVVFKRICRHPHTGKQFPSEIFTRLLNGDELNLKN